MTDGQKRADTEELFYAAEQAGLKIAIKGRLATLLVVGSFMAISRGQDRALDFILATLLFMALGVAHHFIIGSSYDRRWVKYVFIGIDIALLSAAVALLPATPEVEVPQNLIFRFNVFPFYFLFLAVAAFSFSPGLVLWAGTAGAFGWMSAYAWIRSGMEQAIGWTDIPKGATTQQFLEIVLSPNFSPMGSRIQEAGIYFVVAILIAIVMHRARQTVRRQLEAERGIAAISQMFGRFVPSAVADSMIQDEGVLDPVERNATVLFTDVAGFTSLTESKGPHAIVDTCNAFFDAASEIIGRHNGVVTQFQGDAVLATFNVPLEDPDHARNALQAATELLELVDTQTFGGEKLGIRIGLSSGRLVAGNIGGGGRQSYTVYGDPVNLAARLEAMNKEHGTSLLLSQSTAELVQGADLRKIGETDVRGLSEPIGVYSVTGSAHLA